MTLLYRSQLYIFFLACLTSSFCLQSARWPQSVTPFVCSQKSGLFLLAEKSPQFSQLSSDRIVQLTTSVFTLSFSSLCRLIDPSIGSGRTGKDLQLRVNNDRWGKSNLIIINGNKEVHSDLAVSKSALLVNGMFSCCGMRLTIGSDGVKGYLFSSGLDIKNAVRRKQCYLLFPIDNTVQSWHAQEQALATSLQETCEQLAQQRSMVVRVLLSSSEGKNRTWHFASEKGFLLYSVNAAGKPLGKQVIRSSNIAIKVVDNMLIFNGKKTDKTVLVKPVGGHGTCDGVPYDGEFVIVHYRDSFLCVNHVALEDYIAAVLKTESWPGWPLEVNKVFAIACRSYVAAQAYDSRKRGRPFHVKNTNAHQTYCGKHEVVVLKKAVKQTRGMVLGFNKKPILAMFDSCCGGVIPAHISDFDFKKAPYLARTYACTACKSCSLYSWKVSYDCKKMHELCKNSHKDMTALHDIAVIKKDKAGLVEEVVLKGRKFCTTISGKNLYSLLKEVKSFCFDIKRNAGAFDIVGRGLGHHLGLCQWGARSMVRDGWDYKSILQFYYPQTHFMRLS